jgi:hypothetical protein
MPHTITVSSSPGPHPAPRARSIGVAGPTAPDTLRAVDPRDTSDDILRRMHEAWRVRTPAQRVERAASLTILAHSVALAELRRRHPDENERTLRLRLAARWIDAETMRAAFGWCADD